ncbi:MAG: hypothetical protein ACR2IK_06890 [Chloroflexota bacterium]
MLSEFLTTEQEQTYGHFDGAPSTQQLDSLRTPAALVEQTALT